MTFFGSNLKFLISRLGISQASIESVVDKRQTTISNWINGKSNPDAVDLVKLNEFFAIPIDDLCLTDLSTGSLITDDYVKAFKLKGSLKGSLFGSLSREFHQNIGESFHQESGISERDQPFLWSVLKIMQGIDQKLDQIRDDMKSSRRKEG